MTPIPPPAQTPDLAQQVELYLADELAKARADIQAFWSIEEPIVVSELKTVAEQLAGIVTGSLVSVLQAYAAGTIKSGEQFGQLVTTTYQSAVAQGLQITIADAHAAATQAVGQAAAMISATPKAGA